MQHILFQEMSRSPLDLDINMFCGAKEFRI